MTKCWNCDYHLNYEDDTERYRVGGECNYCAGEGICRECKTKCYDCNDIQCCENCDRGYFDPNIGVICQECVGDLIYCEGLCYKQVCKECIGNNNDSLKCCEYENYCKDCLKEHFLDVESDEISSESTKSSSGGGHKRRKRFFEML
mmetsp:Transcript_13279/g.15454  ORF Transcript_13279/g.15454 Transcript_13279/m.15454 type:complete len:146 (+) Transcript_13279:34-471(+)